MMCAIDKLLKEYNLVPQKEDLLKIAASSIGIGKEIANEADIPIGHSKFGGLPDLPAHFSFPKYHNGYLSFPEEFSGIALNDEELDSYYWGDVGILYFCIDKQDLQNEQFDKTEFTLQCY